MRFNTRLVIDNSKKELFEFQNNSIISTLQARLLYAENREEPTQTINHFFSDLGLIGSFSTVKLFVNMNQTTPDPHLSSMLTQNYVDSTAFFEKLNDLISVNKTISSFSVKVFLLRNGVFDIVSSGPTFKMMLKSLFCKNKLFKRQRLFVKLLKGKLIKRKAFIHVNELHSIFLYRFCYFNNLSNKQQFSCFKELVAQVKSYRLFIVR